MILAEIALYVLTANIVLSGMLGVCPALSVWSSPRRALVVGCSLFFVCALTAALSWTLHTLVLSPLGVGWLGILGVMALAVGVTLFMETAVGALSPSLAAILAPHTEQTMLSSAVLGVALRAAGADTTFLQSFFAGLSAAGGFLLAAALMCSVHTKLELEAVPAHLRGVPSAMITLSIMALAFLAFRGIGGPG